jgi:hypothetical protein
MVNRGIADDLAPLSPFIVAGGQAFAGEERRALAIGADAFAADPAELLAVLSRRFGTAPAVVT